MAGLLRQFEPAEPCVTFVERHISFCQEGICPVTFRLLVPTPSDGARPDAARTECAVVGGRCGHPIDVDPRSAIMGRLGLGQSSCRKLKCPAIGRQEPYASRP